MRWGLLMLAACGARSELENVVSQEPTDAETCSEWTIDGAPFVIPNAAPGETSDIAPTLLQFRDGSLSLLLLRARPPDAPRQLVQRRLEALPAWPPNAQDEILVDGFCEAVVTDVVEDAFGVLVKDQVENCEEGGIRWFSPIAATTHPAHPIHSASHEWHMRIRAAAQGPDLGLLAFDVLSAPPTLRVLDANGTVLADHRVPCDAHVRSAAWFDGHFFIMGDTFAPCSAHEKGLSVYRLEPWTGTIDPIAEWPTGDIETSAIVLGPEELWYAWREYSSGGGTPPIHLARADQHGAPVVEPMALPETKGAGAFAFASLRDALWLAHYDYRDVANPSVSVHRLERDGASLEQFRFGVEPGGKWLDIAVDDHSAMVAWDSYATEISTFRVSIARASCR